MLSNARSSSALCLVSFQVNLALLPNKNSFTLRSSISATTITNGIYNNDFFSDKFHHHRGATVAPVVRRQENRNVEGEDPRDPPTPPYWFPTTSTKSLGLIVEEEMDSKEATMTA